jgi:hypothetical protein
MRATVAAMIALLCAATAASAQSDPLPSWRNGSAKATIIEFIVRVTTPGEADYVPAAERFAKFEGEGALGSDTELAFQPMLELLALLRRTGFRMFANNDARPLLTFSSSDDDQQIIDWRVATARGRLVIDRMRDWKVLYPPLPVQRMATIVPVLPVVEPQARERNPYIIR